MTRLPTLAARPRHFVGVLLGALSLAGRAGTLVGQTLNACYVPSVGAIYLTGLTGLPTSCLATNHVAFSWPQSGAAISHSQLQGLSSDDHPQYLLAGGTRQADNGLAVTGTFNTGTLAASGAGERLLWYPKKAAFRAGSVNGNQWDDVSIGLYSTAMGVGTLASGTASTAIGSSTLASGSPSTAMGALTQATGGYSTAMGYQTTASGTYATAMGYNSAASGTYSTAMGSSTASGSNSTAIGFGATASGNFSTAMGYQASTNGHAGTFVYGDVSTAVAMAASADNQFMVRAAGGVIFYSSSGLSTGVSLAASGGSWASVSDKNHKDNFQPVDGEAILSQLAALPVTTWNYKGTDPAQRYMGPTAQDFHALFGLGTDTTIATMDVDGVTLAALQALELRTRVMAELREENTALRARVARLESLMSRLGAP